MDLSKVSELSAQRAIAVRDQLKEYVELESPTGDTEALRTMADRIAADCEALGASTSRVGEHLVVRFPGQDTQQPMLFLGHHDTVHPKGALAWRDEGGVIYGPGVFDMKGGLVVLQAAYAVVRELGLPHRPVNLVVVADEEIGSPTARDLIEAESAGVAAVFGLEPPHPGGALKTARRGSTRVRIAVQGRESHAGLDPKAGVSAIEELVDQLVALRQIVAKYNDVLCNVGTISGGGRTNVVPGQAAAEVGFRFADATTEQAVLDELQALTPVRDGASLTVEALSRRPAWEPSDRSGELLEAVRQAAALIGQEIDGRPASGSADTNQTGWLGIPSIDGLGPVGEGAHARHEQIVAASLTDRTALIAAVMATI